MNPMHSGGMAMGLYQPYSTQTSPNLSTANNQAFDFPGVTIPPRLKNIGRKISQMSNDFLPPGTGNNTPEEEDGKELAIQRKLSHEIPEVPGMGDEPIMCPFCNKPLPPSLLAAQLASGKGEHAHHTPASERSSRPPTTAGTGSAASRAGTPSRGETSTSPAPTPGSSTSQAPPQRSLLSPLPVNTPPQAAVLTATSESLAGTVQEGDVANHTAAEGIVTDEDLKRWSTLSGIPIPSLPSAVAVADTRSSTPAPAVEKAFPLLPPPPAPAGKLSKPPSSLSIESHASSSKGFGFFGKGSKENDLEEDEESDDGGHAAGGYSRLTGPASPSDDEDEQAIVIKGKRPKVEIKTAAKQEEEPKAQVAVSNEEAVPEAAKDEDTPAASGAENTEGGEKKEAVVQGNGGADDSVKKVLQEVLGRVNEMTKSHAALLASHSTLLTSLKIARSNLAMAEANSEMLEDQLKKRPAATAPGGRSPVLRNTSATGPSPSAPGPPLRSSSHGTPRTTGDHVRASTSSANPMATPATVAARTPARVSLDDAKPRPTSLYIPSTGSASAQSASATDSSKSWGFWNGGKKKLPGGLGHVNVPSPAQMMAALDSSRPATPSTERKSLDFQTMVNTSSSQPTAIPDGSRPAAVRTQTQTGVSRSMADQPGLSRSMSTTNVPSSRAVSASNPPKAYVPTQELVKLRQAYSAAVAKMDTMSKELQELKTGKVEMEAELENLSQALFEEANKMVADERRKRAEAEENLKEVKEEREALRQTIKVLGGKVDDLDLKAEEKDEDVEERKSEAVTPDLDIEPRDLDKHYEALRKSIHHVGDGFEDDIETSPLVELPALSASYIDRIGIPAPVPHHINRPIGMTMSSISSEPEEMGQQASSLSVSLPAESNPWAMSSPLVQPPQIATTAATPSPRPHDELKLGEVTPRKGDDNEVSGEGKPLAPVGLGLKLEDEVKAA
ncbi:hypothetical protein CI109_102463 [Kwoniella shandongensis]|uniref:GDP/GTP exchange factor Sec2 N-terminal domain-containing protein n=1 Tax=Kwoniella shandongensis TaxID=1734106 RepID=A0A5M6C163_9TREE|nr:uncharacterized protein CI109_003218 [Kwoniella shandongensis]KAA5528320.1 hypothetical protein CI109_003218 [Kwoniella shandongensis]